MLLCKEFPNILIHIIHIMYMLCRNDQSYAARCALVCNYVRQADVYRTINAFCLKVFFYRNLFEYSYCKRISSLYFLHFCSRLISNFTINSWGLHNLNLLFENCQSTFLINPVYHPTTTQNLCLKLFPFSKSYETFHV